MTIFTRSVFITVAVIQAVTFRVSAQESPSIGPVGEMRAVVKQFKELPRPLPPGETASNRLFATPGWRERMAQRLGEMVGESRITQEEANAYLLLATGFRDLSTLPDAEIRALNEAASRAAAAGHERVELAGVLGTMRNLNDRRIVPLVAPLLAETTVVIEDYDSSYSSPQDRASDVLGELARRGVIEKPRETDRYGGFNVEIWRRWWQQNRSKFDPVPAPLRAIDEGRTVASMPTATPAPVATLSSSPAPAPLAPGVTSTQDWKLPAAIIGGAALLGLGAWAFSQRRRKE